MLILTDAPGAFFNLYFTCGAVGGTQGKHSTTELYPRTDRKEGM